MVHEAFVGLPAWLVWGFGIGVALSLGAAGLFYVGDRLFPSAEGEGPSLSGDSRRSMEIREYLDAIGEEYVEGRSVGGHTVEFYLPRRDVAITFDARAFYEIDGADTHAVLVEHEMPGGHLGRRLPFETPERPTEDTEPERPDREQIDPLEGAHAVLGVQPDASQGQVRAAYRERVKEVHPDHGGSPDEFRQVREAYAAASGEEA